MHLNDPETITRRALELSRDDHFLQAVHSDTRAGYGNPERRLAGGIIGAICETLTAMFSDGVALSEEDHAQNDADAARERDKVLAEREAAVAERELLVAKRAELYGVDVPNPTAEAVAEATPRPTVNHDEEEAVRLAKLEAEQRQASIDSAAKNAEVEQPTVDPPETPTEPLPAPPTGPNAETGTAGIQAAVDQMSYPELQAYAEERGISRADAGRMKSKAKLLEELGLEPAK